MFSIFRPRTELGIVFHIGTASVGAGLVRFDQGKLPNVIYSFREHLPFRDHVTPDRFLADMVKALGNVNDRIARDGLSHLKFTEFGSLALGKKVSRVMYVFSSPWAVTQTKVISIKEDNPFTLTKERVDRAIEAHEKMFQSQIPGTRIIERRIIDIKLNGYSVSDPYGRKAHTVDISFFTSLVPQAVYDKVLEVATRTYHPHDTKAFSFALTSFSVIRDAFHQDNDFIFLDIGGEISDISIVENGLILETASFPLGRHFIIRKIQKIMDKSPEETASLIRLFEDGKAEKSIGERLKPVLDQAAEEWTAAFHTALSKTASSMSLPTKLFVVINNDLVQFFMRILHHEKISEFGVTDMAPLFVTLINHDKLKGLVSFSKHAEKDPFIALLGAFAKRVYETKTK